MTGETVYTFQWTGNIGVSNNNAPTTTDFAIDMLGAERISMQMNTLNVATLAPTFDLGTYGANDDVTAAYVAFQANIIAAQAKAVMSLPITATMGPRWLKVRLDINTNVLAAGEYVIVKVFVDRREPGERFAVR
jgi:hypothetical protein